MIYMNMFNKIMNFKKIHQKKNIKIYIYQNLQLIYNNNNNKKAKQFKILH